MTTKPFLIVTLFKHASNESINVFTPLVFTPRGSLSALSPTLGSAVGLGAEEEKARKKSAIKMFFNCNILIVVLWPKLQLKCFLILTFTVKVTITFFPSVWGVYSVGFLFQLLFGREACFTIDASINQSIIPWFFFFFVLCESWIRFTEIRGQKNHFFLRWA